MCYRTVCNQNHMTNKRGGTAELERGKRDVQRQVLETDANRVALPEGDGQGGTTLPEQGSYIVCGYTAPVVVLDDPD
mgnify:CR=1 FL=1